MIYQLAFWKAVSYIAAGLLALGVLFGLIPSNYAFDAAAILSAILAVLHFFDIDPQVRARGLFRK